MIIWRLPVLTLFIFFLIPTLSAQIPTENTLPTFYVHGGFGAGLSVLSSGDIRELVEDEFNLGISGSFSYLVRTGLRQIIQAEYRKGDEGHNLLRSGFVEGGEIGIVAEREMDYDFSEWTLKINPFFARSGRFHLFVVAGKSQMEYKNDQGEVFEGSGTIYGLEAVGITRRLSVTMGIKRHGITFDKASPQFFGAPVDPDKNISASNWIFDMTFAFGLGI